MRKSEKRVRRVRRVIGKEMIEKTVNESVRMNDE